MLCLNRIRNRGLVAARVPRYRRLKPCYRNLVTQGSHDTKVDQTSKRSCNLTCPSPNYSKAPAKYWSHRINRRNYFDFILTVLGQHADVQPKNRLELLYNLSWPLVARTGGTFFVMKYFQGSIARAVMDAYPEYSWQPWRFKSKIRRWWAIVGNEWRKNPSPDSAYGKLIVQYIEELQARYNIQRPEDWYNIAQRKTGLSRATVSHIRHLGGLYFVLKHVMPHHHWERRRLRLENNVPDITSRKPIITRGYFKKASNRRKFLEMISDSTADRLYSLTARDVLANGGRALLDMYECSITNLVMQEFPEIGWEVWKFTKTPKDWWTTVSSNFSRRDPVSEAVIRMYLDYAGTRIGLCNTADWTALANTASHSYLVSKLGKRTAYHLALLGPLLPVLKQLSADEQSINQCDERQNQSLLNLQMTYEFTERICHGDYQRLYTLSYLELLQVVGTRCLVVNFGNDAQTLYNCQGSNVIRSFGNSPALLSVTTFPHVAWKMWKFRSKLPGWWDALKELFYKNDPVAEAVLREFVEDLVDTKMSPRLAKHCTHFGGLVSILDRLGIDRNMYADEIKCTDAMQQQLVHKVQHLFPDLCIEHQMHKHYTNFVRLLKATEQGVVDNQLPAHLQKKYIETLQRTLPMIEAMKDVDNGQNVGISASAIAEYRRRIYILAERLSPRQTEVHVEKQDLNSESESSILPESPPNNKSTDVVHDDPIKTESPRSDSLSPPNSSVDATRLHETLHEKFTDEMVHYASLLKSKAVKTNEIIAQHVQELNTMEKEVDNNISVAQLANQAMDDLLKSTRGSMWFYWFILLITTVSFIGVYMFMKLFPKP